MGLRVSAIIPVYNGREFLAEAVASISAQTRPVDELIVVDDASTDGSAELAASLGARVLRLSSNGGPSVARNRALREATGDVAAFLDADDCWLPRHCELLVGACERHPDSLVVSARTQSWRDQQRAELAEPPHNVAFDALELLVQSNFVPQAGAVVRREAILEIGGYNEALRLSEDYELWLRAAMRGPFVHVPAVTVSRRSHGAQASRAVTGMFANMWQHRLALLERLADEPTRSLTVRRALAVAAQVDLRDAWNVGNREAFAAIINAAGRVPEVNPIVRRWERRLRIGWTAWHTLRRIRHSLRRG
jgi:GT2 family glycosyltransferase